jgi:hypothetical protein
MSQSRNNEKYFPLHHYLSISPVQQGGADNGEQPEAAHRI